VFNRRQRLLDTCGRCKCIRTGWAAVRCECCILLQCRLKLLSSILGYMLCNRAELYRSWMITCAEQDSERVQNSFMLAIVFIAVESSLDSG
jgi:hypothetical protein